MIVLDCVICVDDGWFDVVLVVGLLWYGLFECGCNCDMICGVDCFVMLVDGDVYFLMLCVVLLCVCYMVFIVGWDVDSWMWFVFGGVDDMLFDMFVVFLYVFVFVCYNLCIYVFVWDFVMIYVLECDWLFVYWVGWCVYCGIWFWFDDVYLCGVLCY